MKDARPLSPILVTDDEPDDIFVLTHNLKKAGVKNPVVAFKDGADLVEYLTGKLAEGPLRALLLFLDIKMPMLDGFDTLAWIRNQPALTGLRVVMFSSSQRPDDKIRAFAAGANEYFEKFPNATDLMDAVARAA